MLGATAPGFTLLDVNGKVTSLEHYRGRVVCIVFWATWCKDCKEELSALNILYKQYRNEGLTVIGINVDAAVPTVAQFLNKAQITFPVLIDIKGHVNDAYRVTGLPTSFLVDRTGVIRHRYAGFGKDSAAQFERNIIEQLKR